MSKNFFPITIKQGATFELLATYEDEAGDPIDLSNYSAEMQIRDTASNSTALVTLSDTTSGITISGVDGQILVTVNAAITAALTAPQDAVYDLKITSNTGVVERLLQGTVCVSPAVTR